MEMPPVVSCDVTDCCYNADQQCRALAIQVGNEPTHPICDTYTGLSGQCGDQAAIAGVGTCKASSCEYNENLECIAQSITVGYHEGEPDCLTFEAK